MIGDAFWAFGTANKLRLRVVVECYKTISVLACFLNICAIFGNILDFAIYVMYYVMYYAMPSRCVRQLDKPLL